MAVVLVKLYDGDRPVSGGTITRASLAEGYIGSGPGEDNVTFSVLRSGGATWFRMLDFEYNFLTDGSVGLHSSDIILNTIDLTRGMNIDLVGVYAWYLGRAPFIAASRMGTGSRVMGMVEKLRDSKVGEFIKSLNLVATAAKDATGKLTEFQKVADELTNAPPKSRNGFNPKEEEIYRKAYKLGVHNATRECSEIHDKKVAELHGKMKKVFAAEVQTLVEEIFKLQETIDGAKPNRVVRLRKKTKE